MNPSAPDLDVKVEAYNGLQKSTAISHVWSDGMGNDESNKVTKCQLERIGRELEALQEERRRTMGIYERFYSGETFKSYRHSQRVHFWLDTLCIPARGKISSKPSLLADPDRLRSR